MKKQAIFIILLITCALGVHANDSITVSASDLQALMQRVERLEQKAAQDSVSQQIGRSKQSEASAQKSEPRRGRFTIGGYGEVTAKHCWYSNNYLRYGQHPEKYANDHFGEFDLPHVVIYLGYDFGKGWSVGTEIEESLQPLRYPPRRYAGCACWRTERAPRANRVFQCLS